MTEMLPHAIDWQNFVDKGSPGNYPGPFGYASYIAVFGINLSDPARITIRCRTHEDLDMKRAFRKRSKKRKW